MAYLNMCSSCSLKMTTLTQRQFRHYETRCQNNLEVQKPDLGKCLDDICCEEFVFPAQARQDQSPIPGSVRTPEIFTSSTAPSVPSTSNSKSSTHKTSSMHVTIDGCRLSSDNHCSHDDPLTPRKKQLRKRLDFVSQARSAMKCYVK